MTTGKYPYDGDNIYKLFNNISKGVYTIPDSIDSVLTNLLHGKFCMYLVCLYLEDNCTVF